MILINTETLQLHITSNTNYNYAVLSHTWGTFYEELNYQEMMVPERTPITLAKPGYLKMIQLCEIARARYSLPWAWIDTCCIDKSSSAELSESINSMFMIYKNAEVCFNYLADVHEPPSGGWSDDGENEDEWTWAFVNARWFTRGWTLQELIASRQSVFYTSDWRYIGTKQELSQTIARHTGISSLILLGSTFTRTSVAERMSWASKRTTTRVEDMAYCLLGLFDIHMPLLYGEGERAFLRLQHEIIKRTNDRTIFLWQATEKSHTTFRNLFARSPAEFASFDGYNLDAEYGQFEISQKGLEIEVPLLEVPDSSGPEFFAVIVDAGEGFHCVKLRQVGRTTYARVNAEDYYRLRNENYVRFANDNPRTETQCITVPSSFDRFSYESTMDFRLGGFHVEIYPAELQIVSANPQDAWSEETRTLELDFSVSMDAFDGDDGDGMKIKFAEKAHPETMYVLDLKEKMREPGGWTIWGPSPSNDKICYLVSMRKQFMGDKMMNVVKVEYQISVEGEPGVVCCCKN